MNERKRARSQDPDTKCPPTSSITPVVDIIDVDGDDDGVMGGSGPPLTPAGPSSRRTEGISSLPQLPISTPSPAGKGASQADKPKVVVQRLLFEKHSPTRQLESVKERLATRHIRVLEGTAVEDQGSLFLPHVAWTTTTGTMSVLDVGLVRQYVNLKVASSATSTERGAPAHPCILAFRLGGASLSEASGTDDDGEQWAAKKILDAIEAVGRREVCVTVTRWFGGKLLGPARFVHIGACAHQVLRLMETTMSSGDGASHQRLDQ